MMQNHPWAAIKSRLDQILRDEEYKPFQPLLEIIQPMINAIYPSSEVALVYADAAVGLLNIIDRLKDQLIQGSNVREQINQIKGGYFQPDLNITGNLNQANRDFVTNIIVTIFENA